MAKILSFKSSTLNATTNVGIDWGNSQIPEVVGSNSEKIVSIFNSNLYHGYDFENPSMEMWEIWNNNFKEFYINLINSFIFDQGEENKDYRDNLMIIWDYLSDFFRDIFCNTEMWNDIINQRILKTNLPSLNAEIWLFKYISLLQKKFESFDQFEFDEKLVNNFNTVLKLYDVSSIDFRWQNIAEIMPSFFDFHICINLIQSKEIFMLFGHMNTIDKSE